MQRLLSWENLTGADFERLDRDTTVVVLSCSPMEVHGPHLPVKTDWCESEALMAATLARLTGRHPDIRFLRLPPIYVAADVVPRRGSIGFCASTIVEVLTDLGTCLCRQGLRRIWISSFHGGPRHFLAIEEACERVNRRAGGAMISVFSLLTKRLTAGTSDATELLAHLEGLSPELLAGDTHAGVVETSLMLHLCPEAVAPTFTSLPAITIDSKRRAAGQAPAAQQARVTGIISRLRSFVAIHRYFLTETYAGRPAAADAAIGERVLGYLAEQAAQILTEVLAGSLPPQSCHSPLWPYRRIFLSQRVKALCELLFGASPISG